MVPVRVAVIPVGGVGARLYPLTVDTSKAMLRFLNRPLLEFTLETLALQGVREFYLGTSGYVNYVQLFDHFGTGEFLNSRLGFGRDELRIRYMPNIVARGNADAVLKIIDYYRIDEPVLIVQCDNVFDIDISRIGDWCEKQRCDMAIVLKEAEKPEEILRFGVADLREDGVIARFVEKPAKIEEAPSRLINTGIYVVYPDRFSEFFECDVGRKLYEQGTLDFGRDVIPALIEAGYRVCGYIASGAWFDIGTPEAYREAVFYFLRSTSPKRLSIDFAHGRLRVMGRRRLSRESQRLLVERMGKGEISIEGDVLLGRHCSVGGKVRIADSIVDHYVVISDGSEIVNSIVMDRVHVGRGVKLVNSITARHCIIDDKAIIENSIVGNNVFVGRGSVVRDSRIWPSRYIPPNTTLTGVTIS